MFSEAGYWWPDGCAGKVPRYLKHMGDSDAAVGMCQRPRRVAIQAGGHNGLWALRLQKRFERVITFEPEARNWECLTLNVERKRRIEARQALLGERSGQGGIQFNRKNSGGHRASFGEGDLPVVAIDDLGLEGVGLIVLDIEGSELPALKGAVRTICRCQPVIMVETRGHGERFGYTDADMEGWLKQAGYRLSRRVARDRIWTPHG